MKKEFLKRYFPFFYNIFRYAHWRINYLKTYLFGTEIQEKEWSGERLGRQDSWNNQSYADKKDGWILSYWDSRIHPHRDFLLKKIEEFSPVSSILEIGANCGPNLYLASKIFPSAKLVGIDINKKAIEIGRELFKKEGILNVELLSGKADILSRFKDNSFDVVFTDATLIYIGPEKIEKIIKEMVRVAGKGIILLEQHEEIVKGFGSYEYGLYRRNYKELFKLFMAEDKISLTKLPEKSWPDKNWRQLGYIIKVTL